MPAQLEAFFKRMALGNKEVESLINQFRDAVLLFKEIPPMKGSPAIPKADASLFSQGKAIFAVDEWNLDELELPEAVAFIAPKLAKLMPEQAKSLEGMEKIVKKEPSMAVTIVRWMLKSDEEGIMDFAEQNELEANALLYLMQNVFQTRAEEMGKKIVAASGINLETWKQGHCPVCGSRPGFSYLQGEGGSRHLTCTACRHHWRFARTSCPYCATDKPDNINLFYVEEKSGQKAEACVNCKRYILSVDLRKDPEDVEFAHFLPYAMIPLDILMSEKEFTPGANG